ncbi:MAG TPA: type II toxin-antitoxin system RelE/ParE family toxin [Bryobacteraceae bacterium]|nr:type II toxin-antitoxin system RelE/ParE family toxin [Bryobacteraceae bacterium]
MSEFRLSPEAEAELDDIWVRIAHESSGIDVATRVVESITDRFWLDLRPGLRSFPAEDYVIIYRIEEDVVLILHVVHGSRDIAALFGH